ncbi:hypothetical protein I6F35_19210 [Bradyrhizobium sp. BRP22]|uniref:hypothetical protein n=1 Tax=Bradyrhizobium sp. BRP22 TaxID=2793821 RepID=UPI001CD3FFCB|nr:hypothetical protein [Bradyrhizobium sp. BRP22]MCA1455319.1 hypothetical protein [Bradyrhizobium sp. BRP22]
MKRYLLCLGLAASLAAVCLAPVLAQSTRTGPAFYVVLNSLTKNCSVVDKTPKTDTPNITVASDTVYKSRAEAEEAIKTLPSCSR